MRQNGRISGKSQVYLLVRGKERRVDAQREAAEQALIRAHVNAVLLDEGHRLMQGGGRYTTDEQLEWLKSLTNRTNVLHVLAGPYELFRFRNTQGQLARRGRDLHFARYHVERAEERKEFVAAVKYLLERVPLSCDPDALLKRWRWVAASRSNRAGSGACSRVKVFATSGSQTHQSTCGPT